MSMLGDSIRHEASIASRPGQMERLEECAREADALVDIAADEIKMANQWRAQYEHAQERYEAQFRLNAELIAGLKKAQAEAWDEGWQAGQLWAFSDLDEYGKHTNPYREASKEPVECSCVGGPHGGYTCEGCR